MEVEEEVEEVDCSPGVGSVLVKQGSVLVPLDKSTLECMSMGQIPSRGHL